MPETRCFMLCGQQARCCCLARAHGHWVSADLLEEEVAKCALHFITLPTILSGDCIFASSILFLSAFSLTERLLIFLLNVWLMLNKAVEEIRVLKAFQPLTRGRWVLINIFYIPRLNFLQASKHVSPGVSNTEQKIVQHYFSSLSIASETILITFAPFVLSIG